MEKKTFGQFLFERRIHKGLTQKELAEKLFVTESAVSKWEQDKRRPDLELISKICEIFDITETELIRASIDQKRIIEKKQARKYRIISNVYNFILIISFGITILTCFIVNLSVSGKLTWFFIVMAALLLAAIILLLPQLIEKYRLLIIPLSWLIGLYLLLGVIAIYTKGDWFIICFMALLLGYSLIFTPIIIKHYGKNTFNKYNLAITITIDSIILLIMLLVIDIYTTIKNINSFGWSFTIGLPIIGYWFMGLFLIFLIIKWRYPNRYLKTAMITSISLFTFLGFSYLLLPLIGIGDNSGKFWEADFRKWHNEVFITSNVLLIILLVACLVIVVFGIIGIIKQYKKGLLK